MTTADREYAAQQLLAFLSVVGPLEAVWAMTTALEALQDLPASAEHRAAAARAFAEAQAEANELSELAEIAPAESAGALEAFVLGEATNESTMTDTPTEDVSPGPEGHADKPRGKKAAASDAQ